MYKLLLQSRRMWGATLLHWWHITAGTPLTASDLGHSSGSKHSGSQLSFKPSRMSGTKYHALQRTLVCLTNDHFSLQTHFIILRLAEKGQREEGPTYIIEKGQHCQSVGLIFGFTEALILVRIVMDHMELEESVEQVRSEVKGTRTFNIKHEQLWETFRWILRWSEMLICPNVISKVKWASLIYLFNLL